MSEQRPTFSSLSAVLLGTGTLAAAAGCAWQSCRTARRRHTDAGEAGDATASPGPTPQAPQGDAAPPPHPAAAAAAARYQELAREQEQQVEAVTRLNDLFLKAKLAVDTVHADQMAKLGASGTRSPMRSPSLSSADGSVPPSPDTSPLPPSGDAEAAAEALQDRIRSVTERAFWDVVSEEAAQNPPKLLRIPDVLLALCEQLRSLVPKSQQQALSEDLGRVDWGDVASDITSKDTLRNVLRLFMRWVEEMGSEDSQAETRHRAAAAEAGIATADTGAASVVPTLRFVKEELTALGRAIGEARRRLFAPILAREAGHHLQAYHDQEQRLGMHSYAAARDCLHKTLLLMLDSGRAAPQGAPPSLQWESGAAPTLPLQGITAAEVRGRGPALYSAVARQALLRLVFFPLEAQDALPETLTVQRAHLRRCCDLVQMLTVSAALANVCGAVSRRPDVVPQVAASIASALGEGQATIATVATEVCALLDGALIQMSLPPLDSSQRSLLSGMVANVAKPHNKLYESYHSRLVAVAGTLILYGLPEGHTTLSSALQGTSFAPLTDIMHEFVTSSRILIGCNVAWYRSIAYDKILTELSASVDVGSS